MIVDNSENVYFLIKNSERYEFVNEIIRNKKLLFTTSFKEDGVRSQYDVYKLQ